MASEELSSNVIEFIHPSKSFPWLEKETYFQQQEAFVQKNLAEFMLAFFGDSGHITNEQHQRNLIVVTCYLRAGFIGKYMDEHNPNAAIVGKDINPTWKLDNPYILGVAYPYFYINGQQVPRLEIVEDENIQKVKLEFVDIAVNVSRIERLVNAGSTSTLDIQALYAEYESGMVEEMAHAFYFEKNSTTPEDMKRLRNDMINYAEVVTNEENTFTFSEEEELYATSPIEQDGNVWVEVFLERYYPHRKPYLREEVLSA